MNLSLQYQQLQQQIWLSRFNAWLQLQRAVQGPHVRLQQQLLFNQLTFKTLPQVEEITDSEDEESTDSEDDSEVEEKEAGNGKVERGPEVGARLPCKRSALACVKQEASSVTKRRKKQLSKKYCKSKKSDHRGVYWNHSSKMWRALKSGRGTTIHLGNFSNEMDAAKRFDLECISLLLQGVVKKATLNFKYRTAEDVINLALKFPRAKAASILLTYHSINNNFKNVGLFLSD